MVALFRLALATGCRFTERDSARMDLGIRVGIIANQPYFVNASEWFRTARMLVESRERRGRLWGIVERNRSEPRIHVAILPDLEAPACATVAHLSKTACWESPARRLNHGHILDRSMAILYPVIRPTSGHIPYIVEGPSRADTKGLE